MANGHAACWGDNRFGQLGTGDTISRASPTDIALPGLGIAKLYLPMGIGDITSDRAVFACAIATDSSFWCWGDNGFGQLGVGDTAPRLSPTLVPGLTGVAQAANAAGHSCVQTTDGTISCWGNNAQGQLGTGDTNSRQSPTRALQQSTSADETAAGGMFACSHNVDSSIACWGANDYGELGVGSTAPLSTQPVGVTTLGNRISKVHAGASHACALTTDGAVWCWGDNRFGQLGAGDTTSHGNDVAAGYAGGAHTCALKIDASVWCWGNNQYGQIRADSGTFAATPTEVIEPCK
jgi:alpha-tubulin suppressor-like RCC1 family protein